MPPHAPPPPPLECATECEISFDVANAELVVNGLEVTFKRIGQVDGRDFDLLVQNKSVYVANEPINVNQFMYVHLVEGSTLEFAWKFYDSETGEKVTLPCLNIGVFGMRNGNHDHGEFCRETVATGTKAPGYHDAWVADGSVLGSKLWSGGMVKIWSDNNKTDEDSPLELPADMTEHQKKRSALIQYKDISQLKIQFGYLAPDAPYGSGTDCTTGEATEDSIGVPTTPGAGHSFSVGSWNTNMPCRPFTSRKRAATRKRAAKLRPAR